VVDRRETMQVMVVAAAAGDLVSFDTTGVTRVVVIGLIIRLLSVEVASNRLR
jgi:hypothetical protein